MKNILTALLLSITILSFGQTTMNIYQSNGTTVNLPVSTIDSVNFTTTPPPSRMNIYQMGGGIISIVIANIDSITYTVQGASGLAVLSTMPVTNIDSTSAVSGGNVASDGGSPITQRGVVWSTTPNPTTANNNTIDGSGTGSFSSTLTGLTDNTTYYVRAYAANANGTAYGNEVSFTTTAGGGGIVSNPGAGVTFDGYTYSSIVLGNGQEWMAENLRTTTYANSDPLPNVTDSAQWNALTSGAWSHYDNDSQYESARGKLYNWYTVDDARNVCPTGWHVPTDGEWNTLIGYLDPLFDPNPPLTQSTTAGGKMKSIDNGGFYWNPPNMDATNESGFSGLPGGMRYVNNNLNQDGFLDIRESGYFWSSTEAFTIGEVWIRQLYYDHGYVYRFDINKNYGISVRCLKD